MFMYVYICIHIFGYTLICTFICVCALHISSWTEGSVTPEKRDLGVTTKGGWIQTSVTISDMNIAAWTQQKQDMFIEAVAATAQVREA